MVIDTSFRFWTHFIQNATPISRRRFINAWDHFTTAIVQQATDRDEGRLRTVEEYMVVRRFTSGADPCYAAAEMGLELPEEVFEHPLLHALRADVTDIIIFDNVSARETRGTNSAH